MKALVLISGTHFKPLLVISCQMSFDSSYNSGAKHLTVCICMCERIFATMQSVSSAWIVKVTPWEPLNNKELLFNLLCNTTIVTWTWYLVWIQFCFLPCPWHWYAIYKLMRMDCVKSGHKDIKYHCIGCKTPLCNICSVPCTEDMPGYSEETYFVGKCDNCGHGHGCKWKLPDTKAGKTWQCSLSSFFNKKTKIPGLQTETPAEKQSNSIMKQSNQEPQRKNQLRHLCLLKTQGA